MLNEFRWLLNLSTALIHPVLLWKVKTDVSSELFKTFSNSWIRNKKD